MVRGISLHDARNLNRFRAKVTKAGLRWDEVLTEVENYITGFNRPMTTHQWIAESLEIAENDARETLYMLFPFHLTADPDAWFQLAAALETPDLRLVSG